MVYFSVWTPASFQLTSMCRKYDLACCLVSILCRLYVLRLVRVGNVMRWVRLFSKLWSFCCHLEIVVVGFARSLCRTLRWYFSPWGCRRRYYLLFLCTAQGHAWCCFVPRGSQGGTHYTVNICLTDRLSGLLTWLIRCKSAVASTLIIINISIAWSTKLRDLCALRSLHLLLGHSAPLQKSTIAMVIFSRVK